MKSATKSGRLMNDGKYDKIIPVIDMEMRERKPNRIAGYDYSQSGAYFITICTQDRKKILSRIFVGTPVLACPSCIVISK